MTHPHAEWTRARLESYVGTTETLTLEFKSYRALLADEKNPKDKRLGAAARDIAGMANEQGGTIIYGIEEESGKGFHCARSVEAGFAPEDGVSREWFLQFIRDRVQPPLNDIDAVDVRLEGDRRALVVLVPQARGRARQTEDHLFWRRDAQGLRTMSEQEIEDVRSRAVRPRLTLDFLPGLARLAEERRKFQAEARFAILNESQATANFAVITVGVTAKASINLQAGWRWLSENETWPIARSVVASGSCDFWSPMTPGFTLTLPPLGILSPVFEQDWEMTARPIGLVRLDHDGGASVYQLNMSVHPNPRLGVEQVTASNPGRLWARAPELFYLSV